MDPDTLTIRIHGMDCAEEVAALKREVAPLVGGEERLGFDLLRGRMTVTGAGGVRVEELLARVRATGMRGELWRDDGQTGHSSTGWRDRYGRLTLTVSSGVLALLGLIAHLSLAGGLTNFLGSEGARIRGEVPGVVRVIYGFAVVCGAWYVLPKAWFALRRLRPDMNLLMTIAVIGAIAIGEWFEAASVSFLFALSLTLEAWSVGRARRAVEALLSLAPAVVRVMDPEGSVRETRPEVVPVGSRFLVRPGERIPLDGEVVSGSTQVNQAPITGESAPVEKAAGDAVYAGTVNGPGALEVRSTRPAGETTLAHIIRMVAEAQRKRAPSEQWVDRFARVYTPIVIGLAVLVLLIPPLALRQPFGDSVYRSLVLLVIACPCALVISTPVSIVAALAASARHGVLIKGGPFVEAPAHIKALAFDKTGTLTAGKPAVAEVVPLNGRPESYVLGVAAALESHSDHPLAAAIVEYARTRGVPRFEARDLQNLAGKGVTAEIDGTEYWVGSRQYLEERGRGAEELHKRLVEAGRTGKTAVVVGREREVLGLLTLTDQVRPAAARVVQDLREAGVEHLVMLTGDNRPTAEAIGRQVGISEIAAELLPSDKVTVVERLVHRYKSVGMVGDGINDAPAMGRASVGIAMGAIGSDAAIEAADVALMSDDLEKLPWLIRHSRRTLAIIRQNIATSLTVKAIFVALAFWGHASLWAAIAADMGVSLLVIFNALRLLRRA
ncbi:MAG: cation-translocating P-type ATPase [Bryobacteraceae bacterium]|nr:cation-translocating P-type ATPase [Bryobacteraceae bacterium]